MTVADIKRQFKFRTFKKDERFCIDIENRTTNKKVGYLFFSITTIETNSFLYSLGLGEGDLSKYLLKDEPFAVWEELVISHEYRKLGIGSEAMRTGFSYIKRRFNIGVILANAFPFKGGEKIPLPKLIDFHIQLGFRVFKTFENNTAMVKATSKHLFNTIK